MWKDRIQKKVIYKCSKATINNCLSIVNIVKIIYLIYI